MNPSILQSKANNLSGILRKVLEAVPIAEAWGASAVCKELLRTGHGADIRTVTGCLNHLLQIGLVREPRTGAFRRVAMKVKTKEECTAMNVTPMPPNAKPIVEFAPIAAATALAAAAVTDPDPIKRLYATIAQLRKLASEAEELVLEAEAQIDDMKSNNAKLRQLQEFLKSLGGSS